MTAEVTSPNAGEVADRVARGDQAAIARVLTQVERRSPGIDDVLGELHQRAGTAQVIGITGPPGCGKSTLVNALTTHYRGQGRTVGVLAVDPSSALSGGAILGDRIRMSGQSGDSGVYIRSLASRGALGGLSRAVLDAITVLDAADKDVIILETVGVGQADVDVISAAQSVVVVSVPEMGDDIQAIKAGILEIADIHVVNKADRPGAHQAMAQLRDMLRLSKRSAGQWNVPIHMTTANTGDGIDELTQAFDAHIGWMQRNGEYERRKRNNSATRIRWAAEELLLERMAAGDTEFDRVVRDVASRNVDPATAARRLIADMAVHMRGDGYRDE